MKNKLLIIMMLVTVVIYGQNVGIDPNEFEFSTDVKVNVDENWVKPIIRAKTINELKLNFKNKQPVQEMQGQDTIYVDGIETLLETDYYKLKWKNDFRVTMKFSSLPGGKPFELLVRFPNEGLIFVLDYFSASEDFRNKNGLNYMLKVANQENTWYNLNTGLYYLIVKHDESNDLLLLVRSSGITGEGFLKTKEGHIFNQKAR